MIKTNYKNLLKDNKVSLSNNDDELQLEYKKLINDMKVFNRDYGSLVVSTLLSCIPEQDGDNISEDVQKVFNIIPNTNDDDMWEQLNAYSVARKSDGKSKTTMQYEFEGKKFKKPERRKRYSIGYNDGRNSRLWSRSHGPGGTSNGQIEINASHSIKAHSPNEQKNIMTSKDVLSSYLSKKPLKFSVLGGPQKDYEFIYPSLHQKVISYLSLIKRAVSLFLKGNDINFSSIDIIPSSNERLAIFIASSEAEGINSFCSENSFVTLNFFVSGEEVECSPLANKFGFFLDDIFKKSNLYLQCADVFLPFFDLNIYSRDKSLRFDTIMKKRMDRIVKTIGSLNNLHNKGNYEFDKKDFDNSYKTLELAIRDYGTTYEKWFKDNMAPKNAEEEIEMLRKELAEKEQLLKKSK